jgi:hypothetical protein
MYDEMQKKNKKIKNKDIKKVLKFGYHLDRLKKGR